MPSLDVQNPGMPDLQFVLFVTALCTAELTTLNVPATYRAMIFDRCWALVRTEALPTDPTARVLDLREGTELTLQACLATIRAVLTGAGIRTLTWEESASAPTHQSPLAAQSVIDRLGHLHPDFPEIVDSGPV